MIIKRKKIYEGYLLLMHIILTGMRISKLSADLSHRLFWILTFK